MQEKLLLVMLVVISISYSLSFRGFGPSMPSLKSRAIVHRSRDLKIKASGESLIYSPSETYHLLAAKGEANSKLSIVKTLHASIMGGIQVGIGGLLCLNVCGNMPGIAATNPGLVKFVFGALFPICLLLVLNTGTQLYTGNTATMAAAYCEKKISLIDVIKSWALAYLGNIIGCGLLALVGHYTGILSGGSQAMAAAVGMAKCSGGTFGQMLVKGIFCNYLVCMAVFLATMARDMTGRYFGIFVPVSTFVATGYEHQCCKFSTIAGSNACRCTFNDARCTR